MPLPVSLKEVSELMDAGPDGWSTYVCRKSGEIATIPGAEDFDSEDPEFAEVRERVVASDDFVTMPGKFDIHEYRIMEDFVEGQTDANVRDMLDRAIRGKGAFRRFKDCAHDLGVIEQWYDWKVKAIGRIAADHLDHMGIAYVDDIGLGG